MTKASANIKRSPPVTTSQVWWLLTAALSAQLPLAQHVPLWLAGLAGLLVIGRGVINKRQWRLPWRGLIIFVAMAGAAGIVAQFRTLFGQNPGVALLLLLLALKPMETRTRRDGLAIVFLCYFLALAQFFYAQSIASAALMLATVVVTTAALGSLADNRAPPVVLLRRAGLMLAQAIPFMLLLFVLFPRVQGPLWGLPRDAHSGLSGLSDSMSPGSISNLSLSDAIAFRASFKQAIPPRDQLYWRGPVLSEFDGRSWRVTRGLPRQELAYTPAGPAIDYEVTLEAHAMPWLFALELPGNLPPNSWMTGDYQLLAGTPVIARMRYNASSRPTMTAGLDENDGVLRRARILPPKLNPRTREVAANWRVQGLHADPAAAGRTRHRRIPLR